MKDDLKTLAVDILGKEYQVACPPGEEESLLRSARYLDEKMREIRLKGKTIGVERIAVMAALNIANELQYNKKELAELSESSKEQLNRLMNKLDNAMAEMS